MCEQEGLAYGSHWESQQLPNLRNTEISRLWFCFYPPLGLPGSMVQWEPLPSDYIMPGTRGCHLPATTALTELQCAPRGSSKTTEAH